MTMAKNCNWQTNFKFSLLLLIKAYQKTRFLRQPSCRFYPSCSQYMAEAIERHGVFMGLKLGVWRLAKCQPLHDGGIDEVPVKIFSQKNCSSDHNKGKG